MTDIQIVLLALTSTVLFLGLTMAAYIVPRLLQPYRDVLRIASTEIPALTGRPLRGFSLFRGVDVVGRDRDRFYLLASYADAVTFGTDASPPRSYFVYSTADHTLTAVTPAEARPHKFRCSWC